MRVLVVMPHYLSVSGPRHGVEGSSQDGRAAREATVSACIRQWNSLLNPHHFRLGTHYALDPVPNASVEQVSSDIVGDVFLCINADNYLVDDLRTVSFQTARQTRDDPRLLGHFCRRVMIELKANYDIFIYVEDDTVPWDPLFLRKIRSFYETFGESAFVLPNRYELFSGYAFKCYLECPSPDNYRIVPPADCEPKLVLPGGGRFAVTDSPYAGFFAVTRAQLEDWQSMPHFLSVSPGHSTNALEQAMVPMLGARPIYRPVGGDMDILEVQHLPNRACHARTPWEKLVRLTDHAAAAGL